MSHFTVTFEYELNVVFKSEDLVECTRYAAACALHTGKRFVIRRVIDETNPPGISLLAFSPTSFDFRVITPDVALAMKAMAHTLMSNIDEIAPTLPVEGPTQ